MSATYPKYEFDKAEWDRSLAVSMRFPDFLTPT